jgi:hypothetical protein
MAIAYPATLPCPLIDGFASEAVAFVVRSPYEAGNSRQRRSNKILPHLFSIEWMMDQATYGDWLKWMNAHGWAWFELSIPSAMAGAKKLQLMPHTVRLTSDLSTSLVASSKGYYWRISAVIECIPGQDAIGPNGPASAMDDWIVAHTPGNPSFPDWYVAGRPGTPAIDIVTSIHPY